MRKHIDTIKKAVLFIMKSEDFHAVIVEGPAGWGKTTAVTDALAGLKIEAKNLGSYSTPLNLYSFLYKHQSSVVIVDDCAGIFASSPSMSILKSATWPQSNGRRVVSWGSSSKRVEVTDFEFSGKIIVICNSFPSDADALAVKSRSIRPRIDLSLADALDLLKEASENEQKFPNERAARMAFGYITRGLTQKSLPSVSIRALRMAYDIILCHPSDWEPFLDQIMDRGAKSSDPFEVLKDIANSESCVKTQEKIFEMRTGFKRRTFYKYKKQLQSSKFSANRSE